jgi:hypothetical protein
VYPHAANAAEQQSTKEHVLGGDYVDPKFSDFIIKLQNIVRAGDKVGLAGMISYPLRINKGKMVGSHYTIVRTVVKTKQQFINNYGNIITEKVKSAILNQDPNDVFQNYQGAMLGSGDVWMNTYENGPLIFVVNVE